MAALDDDIPALAEAICRERVLRARLRSPWEKMLSAGDLFDSACERMKSGIRTQFPQMDEAQVLAELRRRLAISRRNETRR